MTLPLQTGSAIMGARVLSGDAGRAAAERDAVVVLANDIANELASRASAHAEVHVNVVVHVATALVKDSAEAPGGKEVVGGDLLSTAAWAPQAKVDGVHVTDAAKTA